MRFWERQKMKMPKNTGFHKKTFNSWKYWNGILVML